MSEQGTAAGRWERIGCRDYEAALARRGGPGEGAQVYSSLTDLSGEYGEPRIETQWGPRDGDHPVLRGVRHPNPDGGPDTAPCEHWEWTGPGNPPGWERDEEDEG